MESKELEVSDNRSDERIEINEVKCSHDQTDNESDRLAAKGRTEKAENYDKLCGFLNKHSTKSLLRIAKQRWFVFSENNCKLYYYRGSDDHVPLGEIDIGRATFSFDVTDKERSGVFTISTPVREYILEAKNREASLFWLQELQRWRKIFSAKQTQRMDQRNSMGEKGLLGTPNCSSVVSNADDKKEPCILEPIGQPQGVLGADSAFESSAHKPLHVLTQLKTQMFGVSRTPSTHSSAPVMYSVRENSVSHPALSELTSKTASRRSKSPGLNAIYRKLGSSFRNSKRNDAEHEKPAQLRRSLSSGCSKCKELESQVISIEESLSNREEVLSVLRSQLELACIEKDMLTKITQRSISTSHLDFLRQNEREILILNHEVKRLQHTLEAQNDQIFTLEKDLEETQEQLELYQELMKEKDKVVVSLTNEIFDLETEKKEHERNSSVSNISFPSLSDVSPSSPKAFVELEEIESLKDALEAFEIQNKFLNKEILELNHLRQDAEERERHLMLQCSEWEARCYQIQSKLLFLLKELGEPSSDSKLAQEVVTRLLEEAMEDSPAPQMIHVPSWSSGKPYDELGFNWKWGNEEDLLATKAANLKHKSEGITNKIKDQDVTSWRVKWDNFLGSLGDRELHRTVELKCLIRSGIPQEHRGRIWKSCVDMRVENLRSKLWPGYYETLLSTVSKTSKFDPAVKQIELDLLRTLPNNKHYENLDADGISKLRRVLLAYSKHNPTVGYCQGLNRLVAIGLLFLDEEDAFWLLVAIVEHIMPIDYYSKTLIASQVDQRVLKDLMSEKLPRLHAHLEQHNVDLSLFTFTWFLTIFVDNIPPETYLRIWDVYLYEGCKVLFRFSLAFFKLMESELIQMKDSMTITSYLRIATERIVDLKRLAQIAFNELNPFPMRNIQSKRNYHTQLVKAQLEELERFRNAGPSHWQKDEFLSDED